MKTFKIITFYVFMLATIDTECCKGQAVCKLYNIKKMLRGV